MLAKISMSQPRLHAPDYTIISPQPEARRKASHHIVQPLKMSLSPQSSRLSEPEDSSPLHLETYYRASRYPTLDTIPPHTQSVSLCIPLHTTLHNLALLLVPQLDSSILVPPTKDPHPSDIIGARLAFCLVYASPSRPPSSSRGPPPSRGPPRAEYKTKSLGTITIGDTFEESKTGMERLDDIGFVTGDLLFVACLKEGEGIPPLPRVDAPVYQGVRGGSGRSERGRNGGGGRDRGDRGERASVDLSLGWRRGEEPPSSYGGGGYGGRGRSSGIGWTRGGGEGGRERW